VLTDWPSGAVAPAAVLAARAHAPAARAGGFAPLSLTAGLVGEGKRRSFASLRMKIERGEG
jgi:hypothetical protein